MQENTNDQSQSSKNQENGNSSNPQKPSDFPLWSLYRNIIECPLRNFIDATVDNNLAALVKSGFPPIEVLQEAKDNLVQEYSDAMGDSESRVYLELWKEVTILNAEYIFVQDTIPLLRLINIPELAAGLNDIIKHDPPFAFDPEDPKQYQKDLDRCNNRSKAIFIKHQMKKGQLDKMAQPNVDINKPTREYYRGLLISLSDHSKYEITDSIIVYDFTERIKRLNEHYKAIQKVNGK